MSKLKNLKTLNIYLILLASVLVVALTATITFAAMTATQKGSNTITIGSLGTIDCTVTIDNLYPGGTSTGDVTFTVDGQDSQLKGLQLSGFKLTSIILTGNSGAAYPVSSGSMFDSVDLKIGEGNNEISLKSASKDWTDLSNGLNCTITIKAPLGATTGQIVGNNTGVEICKPTDGYLTNSIKSATLTFTINVSAITS